MEAVSVSMAKFVNCTHNKNKSTNKNDEFSDFNQVLKSINKNDNKELAKNEKTEDTKAVNVNKENKEGENKNVEIKDEEKVAIHKDNTDKKKTQKESCANDINKILRDISNADFSQMLKQIKKVIVLVEETNLSKDEKFNILNKINSTIKNIIEEKADSLSMQQLNEISVLSEKVTKELEDINIIKQDNIIKNRVDNEKIVETKNNYNKNIKNFNNVKSQENSFGNELNKENSTKVNTTNKQSYIDGTNKRVIDVKKDSKENNDNKSNSNSFNQEVNLIKHKVKIFNQKNMVSEQDMHFSNVINEATGDKTDYISPKNFSEKILDTKNNVVKQMVEHINVILKDGKSELNMELRPKELGRLTFEMVTEKDIIIAKFTAENQQVKEIIESNLTALKDSLEEKGLDVQGFSVSVKDQEKDNELVYNNLKSKKTIFEDDELSDSVLMNGDISYLTGQYALRQNRIDFIA